MNDTSLQNQKDAANPNYSVWVSASAGTGKTTVLVSRLLRLFLSNVDPTKILCLTYTNAGAIEMQDRIFKRARSWSVMNDADLEIEIKNLFTTDIENFDFSKVNIEDLKITARKLFSRLIDNPVPLKIYTIHAFCQSVLKRFPIEANISPHFKIIEPIDSQRLLNSAYKEFLINIRNKKDEEAIDLLNQFELLTKNLSQTVFEDLIETIIIEREKFNNLLDTYKTFDNIKSHLYAEIFKCYKDVNIPADADSFLRDFIKTIPTDLIEKYIAVLSTSSEARQKKAPVLRKFLNDDIETKIKNIDAYKSAFKNNRTSPLLLKSEEKDNPQLLDDLLMEADRTKQTFEIISCLRVYNLTLAVIKIALNLMSIYKRLKDKEGVMDFSDLIETVEHLFKKPNISEWILYKMDGGISHILIDEAQDTSPIQWDIVDTLTEEFFTTAKSEKNVKSIFSVGDRKQSIFGFQGADISLFEKYKKHFKDRVERGSFVFKDLPLNRSFRSCKNILNLVDKILNDSAKVDGVLLPDEKITHIPNRTDFDGYVELIPLAKSQRDESESFVKPPVEVVNISNAKITASDIVAQKIRHILDNDFISITNPHTGVISKRKAEPRDIMILVQKRSSSDYLINKLHEYNIPFSGQDKLNISENIAVEDLISLIKFTLSTYDDLSLAEVLKSPLYNLDDDDLFTLCYNRKSSLWDALKNNEKYKNIYDELCELVELSRIQTPFLFFDYVLKVKDKRKNFISRFGDVIDDVLNEFIQKCLYYDKEKLGKTLFDFFAWFTSSKIEVKRDMEQINNCVRIMTVHGSKGLEAPIVFLFDANVNEANLRDKILWNNEGLPFLKTSDFQNINSDFADIYNHTKNLNEEEFYRLLYVAMTRARDKLYISGWEDLHGQHTKSWYSCIKDMMSDIAQTAVDPILQTKGVEFVDPEILYIGNQNPVAEEISGNSDRQQTEITIPDYLYEKNEDCVKTFTPHNKVSSPLDNTDDENTSLKKGSVIHKLLENFNGKNFENFKSRATAYLEKTGLENTDKIITQIEKILTDSNFDFMFGANTFAEVEIADGSNIYRIDKLILRDNEIIIIDYKTDSIVPNSVPQNYKNQVLNYKKIIEKIYPDYNVMAFILWFENATLSKVI